MKDALLAFYKMMEISIEIDEKGLRAEGVNLDQETNVKITDRNAREFLDSLKLGYVIAGDKLIVTGPKKAKSQVFCQIYSVVDLLVPFPNTVSVVVDPLAKQRAILLSDGDSFIVDVSETFKPDILGWSVKRGIPILDNIPHVEKLFQNVGDHATDRRYLLITPRIVAPE